MISYHTSRYSIRHSTLYGIYGDKLCQNGNMRSWDVGVLLAIVDIKDVENAKACHEIILKEVDTENLVRKMVDIYIYKIGGSLEKKQVYSYNVYC